jgi:hypothetical protein
MARPLRILGVAVLLLVVAVSSQATAWSNGGYSSDPAHPDYGTHDWIAQHALDWLPASEKQYIVNNLAAYLYGTELPDNGGAADGIGDQTLHHVYYYSDGSLQDDASAVRASGEYQAAKTYLQASNYAMAAKTAGIMSHYIVDPAVFGHVMGASTDWGAEVHHSDYEDYVTAQMTTYTSSMFDPYLAFDGTLENVTAYDATLQVGYDTTFGDSAGTQSCTWMDTNYDWSNSIFKDSAGASLNRAVNALADVLHTLAVQAIAPGPTPDEVAPTIAITSPQNGATLPSSAVTVTGTASDNVAVQAVQISLDGVTWVNAAGTGSWSASLTLVVGENTIHARATDTSGNAAATTISVTVRLSSTGPTPQGLDLVTASLIAVAAVCIVAAGVGFFLMKRKRSDHGRP